MKVTQAFVLAGLIVCVSASAQTTPAPDTSGDGQLKGAYNFRQVSYYVSNALGTLSRSTAIYGTITFDGAGTYSIAGSLLDSTANGAMPAPFAATGTYTIGASGEGTLSGPLSASDLVYGLVANGIFVGSSTASNFNDLFIATPATPTATVANLQGLYSVATMEFPSTDPTAAFSTWFQVNADGNGNFGNVNVNGHTANAATTPVSVAFTGVTYTFANGVGTVAFPPVPQGTAGTSATPFLAGNKTLYVSPDGKFIFGGSTTGWDMLIGTGITSPAPSTLGFSGLYYQAGLDQDVSQLAGGTTTLGGYYGALNTTKSLTVAHQHINSLPISAPYDYTFADSYTVNSDGSYSDALLGAVYILGTNGIRIGYDVGSALGINVAIPAATLSGFGVFLNPQGVVNAASYAPFTAGVSPGEMITLYGTNLSATTQSATALPIGGNLANVQVVFNGVAAPVLYVSPGMISAIVPYQLVGQTATAPITNVQVINDGVNSNVLTLNVRTTSPGVFTYPADGVSSGAALHLDYSLVTTANPAQTGETLAVFVSGLGAVSPAAVDGAAAPSSSPLSQTTNTMAVLVDNQAATVSFAGLAPGYAGLYQINFEVPTGVHSGNVSLGVAGPDSLTSEALLPIATGSGTIGALATTSR